MDLQRALELAFDHCTVGHSRDHACYWCRRLAVDLRLTFAAGEATGYMRGLQISRGLSNPLSDRHVRA